MKEAETIRDQIEDLKGEREKIQSSPYGVNRDQNGVLLKKFQIRLNIIGERIVSLYEDLDSIERGAA